MKRLKAVRNLIFMAGLVVCSDALFGDPMSPVEITGSSLLFVGLLLECLRTLIIWKKP